MLATIMDYGVGNLYSIAKGLERAGATTQTISNPSELLDAECIVFPGVGAFGAAVKILRPVLPELRQKLADGTPALGVCLGMQIMFEKSEESMGEGLVVFKGDVVKLRGERIPQMGWNDVSHSDDTLFSGIPKTTQFYFANSFVCLPSENVSIADTTYGEEFASAVRKGRVCGVQFHPEKSGPAGLKLLENFVAIAEESA